MTLGRQPRRHAARAVIGSGQIPPVNERHDCEIFGADLGRLAVDRRARNRQQSALLRYWQHRVVAFDHRAPFRSTHLPSFRAKKTFFHLQLADLPVQKIARHLLGIFEEPAVHGVDRMAAPGASVSWCEQRLPVMAESIHLKILRKSSVGY
jgi:hypothetical protein